MNTSDRKELANYKEDIASIADQAQFDLQETIRCEWAQANGNDSGFDPYWNLD